MAKHKNVKCECGNSMLNAEKSTTNWAVYDCVCSSCGNRSEKAAAEVRRLFLGSLKSKAA